MPRPTAIVLVAHGSPDPDWRRPLEAAAETTRAQLAARDEAPQVVLAFLGACPPSVPEALERLHAEGHRVVRVVAAFLSPGGKHIKHDLPALVQQQRERWPELRLELRPGALGAEPEVVEAMATAVARLAVEP